MQMSVHTFQNFTCPSLIFTAPQKDANLETNYNHQEIMIWKREDQKQEEAGQGVVLFGEEMFGVMKGP